MAGKLVQRILIILKNNNIRLTATIFIILFAANTNAQNYTGLSFQYGMHFQAVQFFNGEVMKREGSSNSQSISDAGRIGLLFLHNEKFGLGFYGGGCDYAHVLKLNMFTDYHGRDVITYIRNKHTFFEIVPSYSTKINKVVLTHRLTIQLNRIKKSIWQHDTSSIGTFDMFEFGFRTGYALEIGKFSENGMYIGIQFNIFAPNMLLPNNNEYFTNPDLNSGSSYGGNFKAIYMNQIPIGIGFHITPFFNYHKRKDAFQKKEAPVDKKPLWLRIMKKYSSKKNT